MVLVSLCSVTVLVSWLVRRDLQISAEEHLVEINRRLAMETESALANIRSLSRMFIRTVTTEETAGFFFEENPRIAAIFFTSGGKTDVVINSRFFRSGEIDESLVNSFRNDCVTPLRRAEGGETLLLNATPHFIAPVLAMFFPWKDGGAGVLFSPAQLDSAFYFGDHQSYLVNESGDMLIHADFDLVANGVNVADNDFTRYVWDNPERNEHILYTGEDGIRYFRAFTKLNTGGCTVITGIEYDKVFAGIAVALRCNMYLTVAFLLMAILFIWFFAKNVRREEEQQ